MTPFDTCPNWTFNVSLASIAEWEAVYLPPIQKRINNILKPVELTLDEVQPILHRIPGARADYSDIFFVLQINGVFYACAYELSAYGNTTWCNILEQQEFLNFEYV